MCFSLDRSAAATILCNLSVFVSGVNKKEEGSFYSSRTVCVWMSSFVCAGEYAEQLISSQLAENSGTLQVWRNIFFSCFTGYKRPAKRRVFPEKPRHLLSVRREHREESRD